jgi:hypothetical protein
MAFGSKHLVGIKLVAAGPDRPEFLKYNAAKSEGTHGAARQIAYLLPINFFDVFTASSP